MNIYRKIKYLFVGLLTMSFITTPVWSAPSVVITEGEEAYEEALIGLRFRSFNNTGGSELFLGVPDLGVGANRNERNIQWAETNSISWTYTPVSDMMNVTVSNTNGDYSLEYPDVSLQLEALGKTYSENDLNIMQITLVDRDQGSVFLQNVMLDDQALGNFTGEDWNHWMVKDFDFSQGFELTGTLSLVGTFSNSQERSKVEFHVGYQIIPDTTPPTTLIDSAVLTAEVVAPQRGTAVFEFSGADETTAQDALQFECQLNDSSWTACTSPITYNDLVPGSYSFTVRAVDEAGNTDTAPPSQQWTLEESYVLFLPIVMDQ
ncbi:hypothetical protein [Candidatus Leptofilum sp.]|uniref:hypothetical protein n=1 Tax=Candidatus Leptofilum sp. TaxID=3241576 RepID=UPI003B5B28D9